MGRCLSTPSKGGHAPATTRNGRPPEGSNQKKTKKPSAQNTDDNRRRGSVGKENKEEEQARKKDATNEGSQPSPADRKEEDTKVIATTTEGTSTVLTVAAQMPTVERVVVDEPVERGGGAERGAQGNARNSAEKLLKDYRCVHSGIRLQRESLTADIPEPLHMAACFVDTKALLLQLERDAEEEAKAQAAVTAVALPKADGSTAPAQLPTTPTNQKKRELPLLRQNVRMISITPNDRNLEVKKSAMKRQREFFFKVTEKVKEEKKKWREEEEKEQEEGEEGANTVAATTNNNNTNNAPSWPAFIVKMLLACRDASNYYLVFSFYQGGPLSAWIARRAAFGVFIRSSDKDRLKPKDKDCWGFCAPPQPTFQDWIRAEIRGTVSDVKNKDWSITPEGLPFRFVCLLAFELLAALETTHACGFSHNDVTAESILLDARGHIALCDFHYSTQLDRPDSLVRASGRYPEGLQPVVRDIYSYGLVLLIAAFGERNLHWSEASHGRVPKLPNPQLQDPALTGVFRTFLRLIRSCLLLDGRVDALAEGGVLALRNQTEFFRSETVHDILGVKENKLSKALTGFDPASAAAPGVGPLNQSQQGSSSPTLEAAAVGAVKINNTSRRPAMMINNTPTNASSATAVPEDAASRDLLEDDPAQRAFWNLVVRKRLLTPPKSMIADKLCGGVASPSAGDGAQLPPHNDAFAPREVFYPWLKAARPDDTQLFTNAINERKWEQYMFPIDLRCYACSHWQMDRCWTSAMNTQALKGEPIEYSACLPTENDDEPSSPVVPQIRVVGEKATQPAAIAIPSG